ncbi:unnamed protein product [Danaus chrysippus]|uniref:(African queen) hypothetical protein n=1 Tax=Danaus chrysippus TaxID=151541 RepID=A0A8J2R474_9NEOP|nr:unnamed protein product [Danaus chrysippus]
MSEISVKVALARCAGVGRAPRASMLVQLLVFTTALAAASSGKHESPLPTNCTFNDSDWNILEKLVDDELSSVRNLAQEQMHSFYIPSVRVCNTKSVIIEDSDTSSIIMYSRETTPIPTTNLDFSSPVQPSDLKVTVINSNNQNKAQETELSEKLGGGVLE